MALVMAYFDLVTGIGIFVSLVPLVIACTLVYLCPKAALCIMVPTGSILLVMTTLLLEQRGFVMVYAVNIAVFTALLCLASISSYAQLVNEFTTQASLEAKNNELKRINDQLRDVNQQLYDVSSSDPLTSLPNRHHLERYIAEAISRSHSEEAPLGVLMLDIDAFKAYNDALGHAAGDLCLVEISTEIKNEATFNGGFAARFGGEEFVVIICNCTRERLTKLGYAICRGVENLRLHHPCSPVGPYVTISAGGALVTPRQDCEIAHIISRADKALYDAKTNGRNRFVYSA